MVQNAIPFSALQSFAAVARHLRFARAAAELGVTPTAISKTIGQLEAMLQTRLFHRTTRSVSLTEAGQRLATTVRPALEQLKQGVEQVSAGNDEVTGTLRLNCSWVAWKTVVEPKWAAFTKAHPHLELDVTLDNIARDIVAAGFDAGIRPGRGVQQDMVAVQVSAPLQLIVVGAPKYLARAGRPKTIESLMEQCCIRQRLGPERWLPWTLSAGRSTVTATVKGPITVDEMRAAVDLAVAGNGLAYVFESFVQRELKSRSLVRVLKNHALKREPFFLYYPNRRQLPPKLRAFIDALRVRS